MGNKVLYDPATETCLQGIICKDYVKNDTFCCVGFSMEIFEYVKSELNIDSHVYFVRDGNYGALKNNGTVWNGLVGEIEQGKADIAVAALTITFPRIQVIDFSTPYMEDNLGILLKPEAEKLSFINWKFLEPLSGELQLALWLIVTIVVILVYAFENNIFLANSILGLKNYINYYELLESMTYISGVACQRDTGGKNPSHFGAQVVAIVFAFGMVIFTTTYTAVLAAKSLQKVEVNPLKGMNDPRVSSFFIVLSIIDT